MFQSGLYFWRLKDVLLFPIIGALCLHRTGRSGCEGWPYGRHPTRSIGVVICLRYGSGFATFKHFCVGIEINHFLVFLNIRHLSSSLSRCVVCHFSFSRQPLQDLVRSDIQVLLSGLRHDHLISFLGRLCHLRRT